ncbi:Uncharacterized membrane protein YbhN, UPF0104 family [Devosia enhydra]|uniref:Uncharacterized membrane protein YbhN, UPF0104 family n=1 Tax=Devosia enhydra TaxID=665118 RepID=A0A1K2HZV7_9HYPH|nr:lysylphosphatidylglycerol synthase transmembrane domain-containing protein [Devosia enhydra]SFZ85677.1 Uncharacterized membrane protein YbhN, UPF0104 family [Devosia enhydra]
MTEAAILAEREAPRPGRLRLMRWLRLIVPVLILALLWKLADGPRALARLQTIDWGWLAAALLLVNLQTVLSALRWKLVADALGMPIRLSHAVREYYISQLVNQTLPGGVVGDAARAVRARASGGLARAAQGVMIERLAGQLALLLVLGTGLVIGAMMPGGMALPGLPSAGALMILALVVVVAGLVMMVAARKVRFLASFPQAMRDALFTGTRLPLQAGLSLLIVATNLASFSFAALATGTTLGLEGVLILVPLILSAMLIPASVAGWGFREGAAAALFPLVGASASAGLAASLVFGLVILVASLPGALFVIRLKKIL